LEGIQIRKEILFEVEWNQLIAEDWREDVKIWVSVQSSSMRR